MQQRRFPLIWILVAAAGVYFITQLAPGTAGVTHVKTSEFLDHVESGRFTEVVIVGPYANGLIDKKNAERAYIMDREALYESLREHNVAFNDVEQSDWGGMFWMLMPFIFLVFIVIMIGRQMKNAGGGGMLAKIQKSKAMIYEKNVATRFSDVAGAQEAVEGCSELVEYLKDPNRFGDLGGRPPKGIMLVGPSGTGKTLLARAVAGEAGVPFLYASGSSFVEMFVGVGAARVRDLFEDARKRKPCIVFIDEIDAVGQARGGMGRAGTHDEREQTLNELLVQLDGFEGELGIIIMAATNRPEVLDSALTRPGRFDRTVTLPRPDVNGREAILKVHAKGFRLADDVDLRVIARGTPGMTGADLESILNEASIYAGKYGKKAIAMTDLEYAKDKVIMGPERRSQVLSAHDLDVVAFHESGHTIVGMLTEGADPLHKVTVIPRGQALGLTVALPEEDRVLHSKTHIIARMRMLMGGRAAEEIVFGEITSGAGNDLERATDLAKRMVMDLGMSTLGNRTFGRKNQGMFLAYSSEDRDFSEKTQQAIDAEIDRLLKEAYTSAKELLTERRELLDRMAKALRERETLDLNDLNALVADSPPVK